MDIQITSGTCAQAHTTRLLRSKRCSNVLGRSVVMDLRSGRREEDGERRKEGGREEQETHY